jgi:hypothetical protein
MRCLFKFADGREREIDRKKTPGALDGMPASIAMHEITEMVAKRHFNLIWVDDKPVYVEDITKVTYEAARPLSIGPEHKKDEPEPS